MKTAQNSNNDSEENACGSILQWKYSVYKIFLDYYENNLENKIIYMCLITNVVLKKLVHVKVEQLT